MFNLHSNCRFEAAELRAHIAELHAHILTLHQTFAAERERLLNQILALSRPESIRELRRTPQPDHIPNPTTSVRPTLLPKDPVRTEPDGERKAFFRDIFAGNPSTPPPTQS